MGETRKKIAAAKRAAVALEIAVRDAERAREALATALGALRGEVPVRAVAKRVSLSAMTVSNLWRGHVCATPENIGLCLDAALKVTELSAAGGA
ncbi:MAG TPA: hypothetical protein DGD08_08620 [Gemmatimonas aurantiaca]|uniref:Uncharacterized protein n=2 Tax=Gemmatimonas aurantiaca TaxID=173480 RepID=C1A428_GEMAT|nr:hypothetical protein [Gemmatimonas aurantiaca]BAH38853.1 hypothetical protein GAU_1811 [Gemmatimonas aurantiaca T-27]HCT57262.1 hypothetical protein [Gemmatimonas aurantiaca]